MRVLPFSASLLRLHAAEAGSEGPAGPAVRRPVSSMRTDSHAVVRRLAAFRGGSGSAASLCYRSNELRIGLSVGHAREWGLGEFVFHVFFLSTALAGEG